MLKNGKAILKTNNTQTPRSHMKPEGLKDIVKHLVCSAYSNAVPSILKNNDYFYFL